MSFSMPLAQMGNSCLWNVFVINDWHAAQPQFCITSCTSFLA